MTTSYLTTMLALQAAQQPAEAFLARHPNSWVIWEPGTWRPPTKTTLVASGPINPNASGEALALILKAKPGRTVVTLGRAAECDLEINDGTLSSQHLVFAPADGGWTVRDAGSKNGASHNGVRMAPNTPVLLKDGDPLQCAQVKLTYHTPAGMLARLKRPHSSKAP